MAQILDLNTYKLQNGKLITDYTPEEFDSLIRSFEATLNREKSFTGGIEEEQLHSTFSLMESKFFEWRKESTKKTIKEFQQAMMYFDDYSRFVASNHWDNEHGDFYVFNENYHNFDEWRKENVEEILDKSIESLQTNGGMSEASMEAEIAAQENPKPDYLDENGNPHWFDEDTKLEESIDMAGYEFDEYIHSPEFIEKFGDWEKANRLEKLKNSDSLIIDGRIIINGNDVTSEISKLRNNPSDESIRELDKYVTALGKEMLQNLRFEQNLNPYDNPVFTIKDNNQSYKFNFSGIKEAKHHNLLQKGHIEGIYNIPDIIQSSIYIGTEENEDNKKPELKRFHYYSLGIKLDNEDYTAKVVFTENKQGEIYYDQSLSTIEKGRFVDLIKNEPDAFNQINRLDSIGSSADTVYPHKTGWNSINSYYDNRLFRICQVPQMPYLERNPATGKWQPTMEAVELVKTGKLFIKKEGQKYIMTDYSNKVLENSNNSLEQSSLDKASELLKGIQFTPENYKKLLNVINDITEMSGNEQLKVPTEEQVQKTAQEKVQQPQNESQNMENEQKQNIDTFDPNAPVIYGKTILPAFTVMAEGKLHSIENAVVMKFDKVNQTYFIDNGNEKLELPSKTFETLLKDKQEQEEKIKRAEGRTIVFQDKERGIDGTVIPDFSMYTQRGLETFKDFIPIRHNPADDSYVISNGDSTMTITAERFKEITAPERFENKFDENSPAWKKLCEQEYKDFFEPRDNCAYNFRHNLSVYCRKEANSPCDALHLAKDIISRMSKTEQKNTEKLLKSLQNENETMNELIARIYHEAIQEQPLNEEYIKKYQPKNVIARPMYDTISANGTKIENDPALIKGSVNRNLEIGSILKNVNIETGSVFGKGKDTIRFDKLKVISASKEGNTITVMDSNKSFFKLPRDTVLEMYKFQQLKEIKHEQRQTRSNTMSISY